MLRKLSILIGLLVWSVAAQAANVFDVTGPAPFGFFSQEVSVIGWSQATTYTNVSITAPLRDISTGGPIGGVEGVVYLVNQIGPGTTAANNVAPPVSVSSLSATYSPVLLFSGLTLAPGNYYVVFASTNTAPLSMTPAASNLEVVTPGVGESLLSAPLLHQQLQHFRPPPVSP